LGGRLAFLDKAILLGNTGASFRPADPLGGIRATVVARTVYVPPVLPMLQRRLAESTPAGLLLAESVDRTVIQAIILPQPKEGIMSGRLDVLENAQTHSSHQLLFIGGRADAILSAGRRFIDASRITAVVQVSFDDVVETVSRDIATGTVTIVVDSNNDTVVDAKDEVRPTEKLFSFWEADARNFPGARGSVELTDDLKGLEDMATVRITPSKRWAGQHLSLRLTGNAEWSLTEKVGKGIEHLTDPSGGLAIAQRKLLESDCVIEVGPSIGNCPDKSGVVELPVLHRTGDFLFRCERCPEVSDRKLQVIYQKEPDSNRIVIDEIAVDIRPIARLMSMFSAWWLDTALPRPLEFVPETAPIPEEATRLTVLVHGFHVVEEEAKRDFFPTYFKRLYWAKHPVMISQDSGAHVVGVAWPGSMHRGDLEPIFFPDDEFHALMTGKVLADKVSTWATESGPRRIDVIAHSLGTVAVNSALTFLDAGVVSTVVMNEGTVPAESFSVTYPHDPDDQPFKDAAKLSGYPDDRVWINEWNAEHDGVQGPSEVFEQWKHRFPELTDHQLRQKYVMRWRQERGDPWSPDYYSGGPWMGLFAGNLTKTRLVNTFSVADEIVKDAWRMLQTQGKPNVIGPLFTDGTGPWHDFVLGVLYLYGAGKASTPPAIGRYLWALPPDSSSVQYWGQLRNDSPAQSIWPQSITGDPALDQRIRATRVQLIRQWAELAEWFPSTSKAVGITEALPPKIKSLNFTEYGLFTGARTGRDVFIPQIITHSYMTMKPLWQVFPAFKAVSAELTPVAK
jgi:hypothetical protein